MTNDIDGPDDADLASGLWAGDISAAAVDGMQIVTDRLCAQYAGRPGDDLEAEARDWLWLLTRVSERARPSARRRDVLVLAGWLALLAGCVEYDLGRPADAGAARRLALSLGAETGHAGITGWAHEMTAWMALTSGNYRGAIAAARAGSDAAPRQGVAIQLAAQEAKAWARVGDRRQVAASLDRGLQLLGALSQPGDLRNHFVVDPAKFDFYAMDCYRELGEVAAAARLASAVIAGATDPDGTERAPMRIAEARLTLAVAAATEGDLEQAVSLSRQALSAGRTSLPSLLVARGDLAAVLAERHPSDRATADYREALRSLRRAA